MAHSTRQPSIRAVLLACLAAAGLLASPDSVTVALRTLVRDVCRPGLQIAVIATAGIRSLRGRLDAMIEGDSHVRELEARLQTLQLVNRKLQVENSLLNESLTAKSLQYPPPFRAARSEPLVVADLLETRVLGQERAVIRREVLLIDKGKNDGIHDADLVVDSDSMVVDHGHDAGIAAGQSVYAGRAVVGKIESVGRFVSTVQLTTDREFRGLAQLVRSTSRGVSFGAEGMLEGQGSELCRLAFVSSTEPVSVGDEVYTADRTGTLPDPMFYGTVVKAELKPDAPHWDIHVRPAYQTNSVQTVQVLRKQLNPVRLLAE